MAFRRAYVGLEEEVRRSTLPAATPQITPSTHEKPDPVPASPPASHPAPPMRGPSERVYIVAAIVLVAVIIAAALILPGVIHPKGSSNSGSNSNVTVLEPIGWAVVTIGVDQWADITFQNAGTANLSGAFESTNTITAYVMNNAQFGSLIKNLSVDGYEWTSGLVWKGTINYTVSVGSWNLVFFNTNPYGSSGIAATSPIELTKV